MADQILRRPNGTILGKLVDTRMANQIWLYDPAGNCLGIYHTDTNQTRDQAGRLLGTGNLLATLLRP